MVRLIDAEARRRDVAEAVWRLIRRDGFDAASVRGVAAEAGLSTGSIRHFFRTQDELHVFAMEELIRTISARALDAAAEPADAPALDRVRAALRLLLPLTAETEELYRAHLQLVTRAAVAPALQPVADESFDRLQDFYRHLLGLLVDDGSAPPDLDLDRATQRLATLMDGLVLRRLVAAHLVDVAEAGRQLDVFLADLSGTAVAPSRTTP